MIKIQIHIREKAHVLYATNLLKESIRWEKLGNNEMK